MNKKTPPSIQRKHGYKARAHKLSQWLELNLKTQVETHEARILKERVTTQLSCCKSGQAYFWITDRGRSRVIKH